MRKKTKLQTSEFLGSKHIKRYSNQNGMVLALKNHTEHNFDCMIFYFYTIKIMFCGQRSLAGPGPWGRRESDTTKATKHTSIQNTEFRNKPKHI